MADCRPLHSLLDCIAAQVEAIGQDEISPAHLKLTAQSAGNAGVYTLIDFDTVNLVYRIAHPS
jgi:hypothetical protein